MKRAVKTFSLFLSLLLLWGGMDRVKGQSYELSPALSVIISRAEVKKCGVVNTPLVFGKEDFDAMTGGAGYLTFLTLPDASCGTLRIGGRDVREGQTIDRDSLPYLSFEPVENTTGTARFTFRDPSDKNGRYGVCTLYILEEPNRPPLSSALSLDTTKNVTLKSFLKATDPDGDALSYQLLSSAKHGTVQLIDGNAGLFMYTPGKNFTGRDIFRYRAVDEYGKCSDEARVTIHVAENESGTVFFDMTNHWAHNSALLAVSAGFMEPKTKNGLVFFCPDEPMSRGDFLASAMIAAGMEGLVTKSYESGFSDDSDIPYNVKSYAETARLIGIVYGFDDGDGGYAFRSHDAVTRSEAAVIIDRLLSLPESNEKPCFSDLEKVPAWAEKELSAMTGAGLFCGTGFGELRPTALLTRGEAAGLLCRLYDYAAENGVTVGGRYGSAKP